MASGRREHFTALQLANERTRGRGGGGGGYKGVWDLALGSTSDYKVSLFQALGQWFTRSTDHEREPGTVYYKVGCMLANILVRGRGYFLLVGLINLYALPCKLLVVYE